jgi:hypothetical protein
MHLGVKNERRRKNQICILDKNENFEERKCAYFLRKIRGVLSTF